MKLLRVRIISADTCGGLLDGLDINFRGANTDCAVFDPVCFIGPNGAGKSQFLQVLAEMFQSIFHAIVDVEERVDTNAALQFELEYLIQPTGASSPEHVRVTRQLEGTRRSLVILQKRAGDEWLDCELGDPKTLPLLPRRVIGYTSGDNETLSLPFLLSRRGYADDVATGALKSARAARAVPDTRLMLIDYATHLEVLVANLLIGSDEERGALLKEARLDDLHSFRCVVQLAHGAAPKLPIRQGAPSSRKGIRLTEELEDYLDQLRRCATCYDYEERSETYTFDFLVDHEVKTAFRTFWGSTLDLYSAFHKLAMLNDLAIPKRTRARFRRDTRARRFATRLPEPQDEDKVFRFERVAFVANGGAATVDYVSLSDGEHQLAQLLGTFCMVSFPDVLFLLDEPESHFNPQWRVKFISRILDLPTSGGRRRQAGNAARQECLLTTHAPFVPSDMARDKVFIFSKSDPKGPVTVKHPDVETYGTPFDTILEQCFDVQPPISRESLGEIEALMKSNDALEIRNGMERLGDSVEKAFLADRLRELGDGDKD